MREVAKMGRWLDNQGRPSLSDASKPSHSRLERREAVGGPPRMAVGQCMRTVQERVRSWIYLEPNAPGGNGGGIEGVATGALPWECAM